MIKMETKSRYKYIHCDVWKCGVSVFIGNNTDLLRWAKRFYREPEEQDMIQSIEQYGSDADYKTKRVAGRTYDSVSGQWIIHIPSFSFDYDPAAISNLSHELEHATYGILDFVGMQYRYGGNNEAYTYLHEFLLKNALIEKGYKKV